MSKRRSSRAVEAAGAPSKQRRGEPLICLVCGLYADGKVAVACSLLKELKAASVLVGDLAAKRAVSKKAGGAFEVAEYAAEVPHLPDGSIVIVAHDFAQPSRVAAAVKASGSSSPKLLCVIDTRSFLDEWESVEALPPRLREATAHTAHHAHTHAQHHLARPASPSGAPLHRDGCPAPPLGFTTRLQRRTSARTFETRSAARCWRSAWRAPVRHHSSRGETRLFFPVFPTLTPRTTADAGPWARSPLRRDCAEPRGGCRRGRARDARGDAARAQPVGRRRAAQRSWRGPWRGRRRRGTRSPNNTKVMA